MASYPGTVKSFSTKVDGSGQTIFAAHVNDLQDEVVAIEDALLNGSTHPFTPSADLGEDLGTTGKYWATAYIQTLAGGLNGICDGRLTLTTGVPVTSADVTAATTLYYTPYVGNRIALYNGTDRWKILTFTELLIAVPGTTSTMYDVFVYDNAGVATLEAIAWTNDTTRATALTTQNGVLVKSGATTRRYVGSFRTTTVSGQTEDSLTKRYLWNYYHRVERGLRRIETTATWNYTTATFHQANAAAANQVEVVIGVADVLVELRLIAYAANSSGNIPVAVGIGQDSTTTAIASQTGGYLPTGTASVTYEVVALADVYPTVGRHFYAWLEQSVATGTTTWSGTTSVSGMPVIAGLTGRLRG